MLGSPTVGKQPLAFSVLPTIPDLFAAYSLKRMNRLLGLTVSSHASVLSAGMFFPFLHMSNSCWLLRTQFHFCLSQEALSLLGGVSHLLRLSLVPVRSPVNRPACPPFAVQLHAVCMFNTTTGSRCIEHAVCLSTLAASLLALGESRTAAAEGKLTYEGHKIKLLSHQEIYCPGFVTSDARRGTYYTETQTMDIHTRHTVHICRMKLNINSTKLSQ